MTPFYALSQQSEWQLSVVVAWICVLPEEYDSGRLLFDHRYSYEDKGIVPDYNDDNRYELGRIGNHEVVMNCPTGNMGHYNAQEIVKRLLGTFPNIRAALLVGIGGGVPNFAGHDPAKRIDIRLGDVVVSSKIIPYETGKVTDTGRTDVQPSFQPEKNLFGAASAFRSDLRQNEALLQDMVCQAASKPKNAAIYSRPRADHLFVSDYLHSQQCQCQLPQPRDKSILVPRERRHEGSLVRMHMGCIGSADQLLKSAHIRDGLSKTHGIICVEMETAAVMRGNCITVRGISDYCDGHKNDDWHDYAALSAAVCAKELLQRTSPTSFSHLQRHMTPHECYSLVRDVIQRLRNEMAHNLPQNEDLAALNRTLAVIDSRAGFLKDYARDTRFHGEPPAAGDTDRTAEQAREAEEMAANIEMLQQDLKRYIREIQSTVMREAATAPAVTRKEWDKLNAKADVTVKEVDALKYSVKALESTASIFRQVTDLTGNEQYGKAGELLERIPQILESAYTLATAVVKVARPAGLYSFSSSSGSYSRSSSSRASSSRASVSRTYTYGTYRNPDSSKGTASARPDRSKPSRQSPEWTRPHYKSQPSRTSEERRHGSNLATSDTDSTCQDDSTPEKTIDVKEKDPPAS